LPLIKRGTVGEFSEGSAFAEGGFPCGGAQGGTEKRGPDRGEGYAATIEGALGKDKEPGVVNKGVKRSRWEKRTVYEIGARREVRTIEGFWIWGCSGKTESGGE